MTALHERLVYDTAHGAVLDADRRYVLLRADVLMGLFANLDGAARAEALAAFGRSVRTHGAGSVRAYRDAAGADALPSMMEGAAASLGWGRWSFDAARLHDASPSLALAVENSPFAAHAPSPAGRACHAITGMLEALGEALWSGPTDASEIQCAACGGAHCRFVVAPRTARVRDLPELPPARRRSRPGDSA
jgi:predicted hydrocarbon binding protein